MTLFHELVEKQIDDPRGRLTRLIRYTKSDPKAMIQHCVQSQHQLVMKMQRKFWTKSMKTLTKLGVFIEKR